MQDVDRDAAVETVSDIEDAGGEAASAETNVTDADAASTVVDAAVDRYGRLDVTVNNASIITPMVGVEDIEEAHWDRLLAINLADVWNCLRAVLATMEEAGGSIVNVASVAGLVGVLRAYAAITRSVSSLSVILDVRERRSTWRSHGMGTSDGKSRYSPSSIRRAMS